MDNRMNGVERAFEYDPQCLSPTTAIKAVWLLYRWGAWSILESLGIGRHETEAVFEVFDDCYVEHENGGLTDDRQVERIIQIMPNVLNAALQLAGLYMLAINTKKD